MRVLKSLNNNVALVLDEDGSEAVVFSKGIGFPKTPYDLDEQSAPIQRVFRDIDSSLYAMVRSLSSEVLTASIAIADLAATDLKVKLNQNLAFTLADHLQFAVERAKKNMVFHNPLAEELSYVYPREVELARRGMELFCAITGIRLPDDERYAVALHLVNAEVEGSSPLGDMTFTMQSAALVDEVVDVIERDLNILIDRMSYSYARFTTHLRYLIRRLREGKPSATNNMELFASAKDDFKAEFRCAQNVAALLARTCSCELNEEELLYLLLYINRLRSAR